ncbi:MAG: TIGR00282 family metallophosphoesterase [Moorellales bacterium]
MRFVVIGDIVGRPGRRALRRLLPGLLAEVGPDLVVANGENAAGGNGITRAVAAELFSAGVNVITTGNHVWDQKEALELLDEEARILRPANYPAGAPGQGWGVFRTRSGQPVGVMNLSGRVFQSDLDCPFRLADALVEQMRERTPVILVDFHAEATSEKQAFAWYLDGRVSAVLGTHTHVQTNDARILPGGTAYITDLGMTGPRDSVLGVKREIVIRKFLSQMPVRFEVASGPVQMDGVVLEVDAETGKAQSIRAIKYFLEADEG